MKATLVEKRTEATDIKSFSFKTEKQLTFEAGQFAFLNFKANEKEFSKHFSFSSAPTRTLVQMTTILSGSDYKNALDALPIGTITEFSAPMGSFTLRKAGQKRIVFLAGGIGITPVKSMLEFLADIKQNREITFFYSNRTIERIAFRQELEELQQKIPSLKVIHTITELTEPQKTAWNWETGFISKAMVEKHNPDNKETIFFVVGPPKFVEAMQTMLKKEMQIKQENIVTENFSGY